MADVGTAADGRGYRAALRVPIVRVLAGSFVITQVGDWVGTAALLVLAFERAGGAIIAPAALFAVRALPALLAGAVAGSWLDQVRRDRALVAIQVAGAVGVVLPVVWTSLAAVYVAGAWLGVVTVAHVSVNSAAMAEGVPDRYRGPLLALVSTTQQASQVVGFAAGGALAVVGGATVALLADGVTFLVAAAVLVRLVLPAPETRDRRPPLTAGVRDISANPVLGLLAILALATAAVAAIPEAMAPAVVPQDDPWLPFVLAAGPAGQAVTIFAIGGRRIIGRPSYQLWHIVGFAVALGVATLAREPWMFAVANLLVGAGAAWIIAAQLTFIRIAPKQRMAQITGTMIAGIIAAEGAGTLALGAVAEATGVQAAYALAGVWVALLAAVGWVVKGRMPAARILDADPDAVDEVKALITSGLAVSPGLHMTVADGDVDAEERR